MKSMESNCFKALQNNSKTRNLTAFFERTNLYLSKICFHSPPSLSSSPSKRTFSDLVCAANLLYLTKLFIGNFQKEFSNKEALVKPDNDTKDAVSCLQAAKKDIQNTLYTLFELLVRQLAQMPANFIHTEYNAQNCKEASFVLHLEILDTILVLISSVLYASNGNEEQIIKPHWVPSFGHGLLKSAMQSSGNHWSNVLPMVLLNVRVKKIVFYFCCCNMLNPFLTPWINFMIVEYM